MASVIIGFLHTIIYQSYEIDDFFDLQPVQRVGSM